MKKKKALILSSLILAGISIVSCSRNSILDTTTTPTVIPTTTTAVTTSTKAPTPTVAPTTTISQTTTIPQDDDFTYDGYYSSITNDVLSSSSSLRTTLNSIITKDSVKFSYTTCTTKLKTIDSYDGDYVECLYTGQRIDKDNSGSAKGSWNKEHIWAKSHGFNDNSLPAYTDLHHLRVAECSINNYRKDSYFDEITDSNANKDDYGNTWLDGVFEPRDEVKGDVARMLLYMDVRYDDSTLDLILTDDKEKASIIKNDNVGYMGLLSTILKWNFEDPVDSRELYRNEEIYNVQKNRNPFIDHPELAYFLYKDECQEQGISGSGLKEIIKPTLKDDAKISAVNSEILKIGNVTLESEELIKNAEAAYYKLDDISQSFVSEYYTLVLARYKYEELKSINNQDNSISTSFDIKSIGAKEGSAVTNGVSINWTGPYGANDFGIYAQTNKNVTISASNLYEEIKNIVLTFTSNKDANTNVIATVTITDGTNTVSGKTGVLAKGSQEELTIDISSLDVTKGLTITIASPTSSILQALKFSVI